MTHVILPPLGVDDQEQGDSASVVVIVDGSNTSALAFVAGPEADFTGGAREEAGFEELHRLHLYHVNVVSSASVSYPWLAGTLDGTAAGAREWSLRWWRNRHACGTVP